MAKDFATEGGHWYALDGTPRYTVLAKGNGQERPTTLRDARANGWLPSVTTVIGVARKPGLELWLEDQAYQSAFTTPQIEGEAYPAWKARVKGFAQEAASVARDRGTYVHGGLECAYRGQPVPVDLLPIVQLATAAIDAFCGPQQWSAERSFGCAEGYGGKVDLHSPEWVIDFKTKDGVSERDKLWDEHYLQLSAYRHGLGLPTAQCAIAYVDRTNGETRVIAAEEDHLRNGMEMFRGLLAYWKAKNRYWPGLSEKVAA